MDRIASLTRFVLGEFGPLIGFWLLALTLGTKPAIAGAVVIIVADAIWRYWRGIAFTKIYLLTSGLTLMFGAVDLLSATPFMLKYESVITNAVTGIAFVLGAYGQKPMIQEVAEQREGKPFPEGADIRRYFQLFTLFWAAYFFVKAIFYFWTAWTMPMLQAMALRSVVGSISLGLMIAVSATQGRRMFLLCRKWGLLPMVQRAVDSGASNG
ncbi:Intracellular septation protein A [Rhizobiales bacterium GAS188]|nr:Intracellular septation protein A [Rhizobiales bacterium GAS188]